MNAKEVAAVAVAFLELPADSSGELLLQKFCRIHQIPQPRRPRAIFDALIKEKKAKDFPSSVIVVATWLRDWPGVEINLT